ncbi:MAG TPA: SMC family ATPase [Pyrinomonadaceae bacterium]|nr:SMC family ATPase [Pyrinomonadaceae bacterium]
MHVTRVELENIKVYERTEYTFERGTTAIVGENGAGKTTILESIAWALFDTLEYSKDDFLRRGAKKGSVRVSFQSDLDEREYTVYRDTGNGYYVFDRALGVKLAEKKVDVKKFLDQHLGIEPGTDLKALFRSAIGVPQGLFTTDFLRTPTERKTAFDRLLKVEEYRESAQRLGETMALIRERVTEARERIGRAEGQLARYDDLLASHEDARERTSRLAAELADVRREAEERAQAVSALDAAERRVTETRAAADRAEVERAAASRRLADLQHELEAARRAGERQRACESGYRSHLAALEALRALEAERAERDRLSAELNGVARMVSAAETDARRLTEAVERAAEARAALAELDAEVTAQEEAERERERLRDLLARASAAREQLVRLDRELDALRKQHVETTKRVRAAEGAQGAAARVENLEIERGGVEAHLSRVEQSLNDLKHLTSRRREQLREVERLRRSVAALEREEREVAAVAAEAGRTSALEARERELTQQAAELRAAIAHDERIRAETQGGVCPILGERCTSFGEGRTFESYFGDRLKTSRARLASVEREVVGVVRQLGAAREAEKAVARFETTRARLLQERELLAERERSLASIEAEIRKLSEADERLKDKLQADLMGIDLVLKTAREEALRYAELEPLRVRLREIEEEGKSKKETRQEVAAAASAEEALAHDIKEVEGRLRAMNDPRTRAAALRAEAAREASLKIEAQGARDALTALNEQRAALEERLKAYGDFETRWSAVVAQREETTDAYREYLETASLAATLPARERDAQAAAESAAGAQQQAERALAEHEAALAIYDRERHNRERGLLEMARVHLATTTAQLEAAREAEAKLADEIAALETVRATWREEIRAKERLEELQQATDFVRDVLKQAGPLVTESYLYNISIEANQLFREITGEGGRALRWSKDYDIVLEEGGHDRSFVNLSGGEQMVAALSVRLALLKQLSDIRIAFFDEPTVNMDAERRERLAQQLGQVRHFDQLFVISHDDTFEETVDHVVSVSAREREEAA